MRALWELVHRWWLSVAATLAAVTVPFSGVLTGSRTAMYGDVNEQTVPFFASVWREIRGPGTAFWNPNIFAGHSTVGTGQFAVFYPFNVVFGWLEPVEAYRWWFLFHLWAAGLAAFAWAWHRWRSRPGAVIAGAGYALSGYVVFHLMHPAFLAAAAWLPLAFLGVDLLVERWSAPRALLVAVPLALTGLLGQPQLLWMAGLGVAVYAVARVAGRRPDWPALGRVGLALGCGVGLAMIQLLPLFEFSRTSVRPTLDVAAAFEGSILPHQFLMLLFPYLFGGSIDSDWATTGLIQETGAYAGVVVIALAVVGVAARRRDRTVWALLAVGLVATIVALGGSTPLGRMIYTALPGASLFRHWGRTVWLLNLVMALLAALGARELLRAPRRFLPGLAVGVVGMIAAAEALPLFAPVSSEIAAGSAGGMALARPAILLFGVVLAVVLAVRWRRIGVAALVAVCALDMVLFAAVAPWRISADPEATSAYYDQSAVSIGAPHDAPGGIDRWASDWYGFRSLSVVKDLHGVNGYDPLLQGEWAETAGGFLYHGNPTRPDLWGPGWIADVLRVSTMILQERIDPAAVGWQREFQIPGLDFIRWVREPRLPEAYLVGAVVVASLSEIRAALVDPATPLDRVAYVERSPGAGVFTSDGFSGTVVSADVLDGGEVVVDAATDSLLVLSHTWAEGWRASVDGRSVPVLRTNGLVLGVAVPAGHHVVRVRFVPPGLIPGLAISVLSLLVLVTVGPAVSRWRRRESGVGSRASGVG